MKLHSKRLLSDNATEDVRKVAHKFMLLNPQYSDLVFCFFPHDFNTPACIKWGKVQFIVFHSNIQKHRRNILYWRVWKGCLAHELGLHVQNEEKCSVYYIRKHRRKMFNWRVWITERTQSPR